MVDGNNNNAKHKYKKRKISMSKTKFNIKRFEYLLRRINCRRRERKNDNISTVLIFRDIRCVFMLSKY